VRQKEEAIKSRLAEERRAYQEAVLKDQKSTLSKEEKKLESYYENLLKKEREELRVQLDAQTDRLRRERCRTKT